MTTREIKTWVMGEGRGGGGWNYRCNGVILPHGFIDPKDVLSSLEEHVQRVRVSQVVSVRAPLGSNDARVAGVVAVRALRPRLEQQSQVALQEPVPEGRVEGCHLRWPRGRDGNVHAPEVVRDGRERGALRGRIDCEPVLVVEVAGGVGGEGRELGEVVGGGAVGLQVGDLGLQAGEGGNRELQVEPLAIGGRHDPEEIIELQVI
jgi:hypothetical protein